LPLPCLSHHPEPRRVLIADDSASSRDLLRSILEASDYIVAEAKDGEQVLKMIESFRPHLVILDLQMPQVDGYATAAVLKQNPRFGRTPILALTAALSQTAPHRIAEAGFSAYLVKPVRPISLRQSVSRLLDAAQAERL
jgi:CheY-like chemotaxis protein